MPEQTALSDREALDRLALFMAHPGQWNGGDVCEVAAELIIATGRPNFDDTAVDGEDGDEPHPAYVAALAAHHAATPASAPWVLLQIRGGAVDFDTSEDANVLIVDWDEAKYDDYAAEKLTQVADATWLPKPVRETLRGGLAPYLPETDTEAAAGVDSTATSPITPTTADTTRSAT